MAVIDYEMPRTTHRRPLRWVVAIVTGAIAGVAVAQIAFEPMLRAMANGQAIYFFGVDEPLRLRGRFTLGMSLAGVLIGFSVAVVSHPPARRRSAALWAVVFSAIFCAAASLCLVCVREDQQGLYAIGGPVGVPAASAPTLIAPLAGCAAVVVSLGAVLVGRRRTARPAA